MAARLCSICPWVHQLFAYLSPSLVFNSSPTPLFFSYLFLFLKHLFLSLSSPSSSMQGKALFVNDPPSPPSSSFFSPSDYFILAIVAALLPLAGHYSCLTRSTCHYHRTKLLLFLAHNNTRFDFSVQVVQALLYLARIFLVCISSKTFFPHVE